MGSAGLRENRKGAWGEIFISSVLGLIASLVLSVDAIVLAADPSAALTCNINAKISCAAVGTSWQASVLGFPNTFIGLMAEPVIITIAVASLAGVQFPRWFMLSAQAVTCLGVGFAYWLFFQAYFFIGALCPWCLLITVTTTLVFSGLLRINVLSGAFGERLARVMAKPIGFYQADIAAVILVLGSLAGMVIYRYV